MRNIKSRCLSPFFFWSLILLSLFLFCCSERNPNNPFDPEVNTEFPAPTLLSVSNFGLAKIEVKFSSDYDYFTKYQIERKTDQTNFIQIAEMQMGTWVYVDSLINADTLYIYRVRGMVDELPSPYSNIIGYTLTITPPVDILIWAPDDHTIGISWNMSELDKQKKKSEREGYEFGTAIERKIAGGSFAEIVRLPSEITNYEDSALSVNTDYTYRLRTYLNQSHSAYSTPITLQTQIVQPPSQLTAAPLSDQQIHLIWQDDCEFETGFKIERKEDGGSFQLLGTVEENITSFTDTGLLLSINYTYRVQTFTDYNVSDYSNEAGTGTFFPAPFNLTAEAISDQNIVLAWEYEITESKDFISIKDNDMTYKKVSWNSSRFQQGFCIERKEDSGYFSEIGTTAADVLNFTDQGLLLGVNYQYRVRAFTDLNFSDYSNLIEEQTFFPAPDNLMGTSIIDDAIELTWNDNCTFEETYHLEISIAGASYQEIALLPANTTSYTDTGLQHGPQHLYRIRAGTSLNFSDYSLVETIVTFFPPPTQLIAELASFESVELEWVDNCSFEDGYSVQINEGGGFYEIAFTTDNTCNLTGLLYGTEYEFMVQAKHGTNYSSASNIALCTILLSAPTDLTTEIVNDQTLYIQWNDLNDIEEGFSLERSTNGGAFTEIATTSFDVHQYWDNGLLYGNDYTYRVRAFAAQYYSPYSNQAASGTSFPAPTNLISLLLSDEQVELNWQDNCNWESGFAIERRDAGSNFMEIATVSENTTTFSDETVVYGLEYIYRVRAFTDINYSDYTNETSQLVEISAPTNLTAAAASTSITLVWNDNSAIEENYQIERMTAGNNFELIVTLGENSESYEDVNVVPLTTYFYRVRAVTANNQSNYSNIANATVIGE